MTKGDDDSAGQDSLVVRFGDVDATVATEHLTMKDALNSRPTVGFVLNLPRAPAGVDYLAPIRIGMTDASEESSRFHGNVLEATPAGEEVWLQCAGGQLLVEGLMGGIITEGMAAPEIVHMVAREAGMTEERIRIPALAELPSQVFEVVVPVAGVTAATPVDIGRMRLLPAGSAEVALDGIAERGANDDPGLIDEFLTAECYALVHVTDSLPYRAEREAFELIDWVLAWLAARSRYGLVRYPDGTPQRFVRSEGRARPHRVSIVGVRGLLTGGRWLRRAINEPVLESAVASSRSLAPPSEPTLDLRQSLIAAQRAAAGDDPIQRVAALSEAIEFLVRDVKAPKPLTSAARKTLREVLVDSLPSEHHPRIDRLIALVNDAPLMQKLEILIEQDGVPFSSGDMSLLKKLRDLRNDALHGRGTDATPDPEDLDHATALLSRLILYRIERSREG